MRGLFLSILLAFVFARPSGATNFEQCMKQGTARLFLNHDSAPLVRVGSGHPFTSAQDLERFKFSVLDPKNIEEQMAWLKESRYNAKNPEMKRMLLKELDLYDLHSPNDPKIHLEDYQVYEKNYGSAMFREAELDKIGLKSPNDTQGAVQELARSLYPRHMAMNHYPLLSAKEITLRQRAIEELLNNEKFRNRVSSRVRKLEKTVSWNDGPLLNQPGMNEFLKLLPEELSAKLTQLEIPPGPLTREKIAAIRQELIRVKKESLDPFLLSKSKDLTIENTGIYGNALGYRFDFLDQIEAALFDLPEIKYALDRTSSLRLRQLGWSLQDIEKLNANGAFANSLAASRSVGDLLKNSSSLRFTDLSSAKNAVAELELYLTQAEVGLKNGETFFPKIVDPSEIQGAGFDLKDLKNPLLLQRLGPGKVRPTQLTAGPLSKDGYHQIISGGNNGGKTTNLKSIAQAWYRAMSGSPISAKEGSWITATPLYYHVSPKVMSASTRGLQTEIGYGKLMLEGTAIKRLMDHAAKQPKPFVLLDEIITGSTPDVNQVAEMAVLKKLDRQGATVVSVTHNWGYGKAGKTAAGDLIGAPSLQKSTQGRFGNKHVENFGLADGPAKSLDAHYLEARKTLESVGWSDDLLKIMDEEWLERFPNSSIREKTR